MSMPGTSTLRSIRRPIAPAAPAHRHAALNTYPAPSAEILGHVAQLSVMGAFVSAKRRGRLRSCCGFIGHAAPLSHAISHAAARTANDDHRFPPISLSELE